MTDNKLTKTLHKQVKEQRGRIYGKSNKWDTTATIGPNSKAATNKYKNDISKYHNSDTYKNGINKLKSLDRQYNNGTIDVDQYNKQYSKIRKSLYKPEFDNSHTINGSNHTYVSDYMNTYGKDLTMGYLKDLGYNDKVATEFTRRILQSDRKLIN